MFHLLPASRPVLSSSITRSHRPFRRFRLAAPVGALVCCATAAAAVPQYSIVDLGRVDVAGAGLPWQPISHTFAPADWPSIAGGTLGPGNGVLYARYGNTSVGASPAGNHQTHAAKWVSEQESLSGPVTVTVTDLGVLPGALPGDTGLTSIAIDFNNLGDVVGFSNSAYASAVTANQAATHAFLYHKGQMFDLGSLAGPDYNSSAKAVNDSDEVVGFSNTIASANGAVLQRAFVYVGGAMYNLSFYLVNAPADLRLSDAWWISCQGDIAAVGTLTAGGPTHSYLLVRQGPARNCPD